jgi:hypothetical protein
MDQLSRIAGILGSVDLQTWPEAKSLPDYGKVAHMQLHLMWLTVAH